MPSKYPDELRERAVRMVLDHEHEYGSRWEAICSVAEKLGPKAETVRQWIIRAETDSGRRPGVTTDELAELKRLKRENAELNPPSLKSDLSKPLSDQGRPRHNVRTHHSVFRSPRSIGEFGSFRPGQEGAAAEGGGIAIVGGMGRRRRPR